MGTYQTETMKFRAMRANGELLKAPSPDQEEIKKIEETLRSKRASSGRKDDEDTAELKDLVSSRPPSKTWPICSRPTRR